MPSATAAVSDRSQGPSSRDRVGGHAGGRLGSEVESSVDYPTSVSAEFTGGLNLEVLHFLFMLRDYAVTGGCDRVSEDTRIEPRVRFDVVRDGEQGIFREHLRT